MSWGATRKQLFVTGMVLSLALGACESMGVPPAESFNDRVGYALGMHTAVLQTATTAVTLQEITSVEAENVADVADRARDIIDAARRIESAGDIEGANRQLTLAITILQELQTHLRGGSP